MTDSTTALSLSRGGMDTAELLFDPPRLSELIGASVRATRLRHKAGHSTVAALTSEQGQPVGWIRVMQPQLIDKVQNIVRRATERGRKVIVRDVPGTRLWLAAGGIGTDPRLIRALDEVARQSARLRLDLGLGSAGGNDVFAPSEQVLRYNPMRRLLLRAGSVDQPEVLRVSAERAPAYVCEVQRLAAAGAPVAAPQFVGRRASRWPWVGTTDLAALIDASGAGWEHAVTEAGRTLARVHAIGRRIPTAPTPANRPTERLTALGEDLAALDARLGVRFGRLARRALQRTRGRARGLIHGDCSADQVAVDVDTAATTWLDFERIRVGDVREDLGSFAAAELLRAPDTAVSAVTALLAGYDDPPDQVSLHPWTARALLGRVLEPFRAADPDWRAGISARLDQAEALL